MTQLESPHSIRVSSIPSKRSYRLLGLNGTRFPRYNSRNCWRPTIASTKAGISAHQVSTPRRLSVSACSSISRTGTHFSALPWIVITAADSGLTGRLFEGYCRNSSWCCSMNAMHFNDSRTARTRSIGDGIPPCNVWPSAAERASNSDRPSSKYIFVKTLVV